MTSPQHFPSQPEIREAKRPARPARTECPHCEYDRRFPDFERGGWIWQDNNGPIVACPVCNPESRP